MHTGGSVNKNFSLLKSKIYSLKCISFIINSYCIVGKFQGKNFKVVFLCITPIKFHRSIMNLL